MGAHVSVPMYHRTLPQRLALEARRCAGCGFVEFPPRDVCGSCRGRDLEAVRLSGRGRVHTWTRISATAAPPEFAEEARRLGGYHVAIVELEEGPRITGQLVELRGEPTIDMAVEVVTRRLYDEEGVRRYGFKFVPARGGAGR